MRSGSFDVKNLAATGICLTLAMSMSASAQRSGIRYQAPVATPAPTSVSSLPPAKPYTLNGSVVADIVVRVNDSVITRNDLLKAQQGLAIDVQAGRATQADANARQHDLLRDLIDEQLLLARGKELGINVDSEVVRRLDDIRKSNHLDSMEDLQKAVGAEGSSYEDLKSQIANNLITQQVLRDEVARRMQPPTPEQLQTYYNAHKNEFMQPEQIALSEILVPTAADATDAQVTQARQHAEAIIAELKAGAKFEDEAKKNSGGQTAAQGGELGVFKVGTGTLAKVFEDQTASLPAGGLTAPIRTRQGYVILKVTQHVAAGPQAFKDAEQDIQGAIFTEEYAPSLRTYLSKLRDAAYIDIAPGFTDTGRSPNEAKAIFAAATLPPAPKVKKKKTLDSRFTRTAASAAPAKGAIPALPPASANGTLQTASNKKPKKIKREKVRFGQAPRNALAPGTTVVAEEPTGNAAPGPAASPQAEAVAQQQVAAVAEPDVNPLAPQAPEQKKTRFAKTEPYNAPKKPKKPTAKDRERALAQPVALSSDQKTQQQLQDEAHGLNGDTAKKPKKPKKVKGQPAPPKERIQDRPAPTAPAQPAPTVNPDLVKPMSGTTSGTTSDSGTQNSAPASK